MCGYIFGKCIARQSERVFADICEVFEAGQLVLVYLIGFDCRFQTFVLFFVFVSHNSAQGVGILVNQICHLVFLT